MKDEIRRTSPRDVRSGPAGWSYSHWNGVVYPGHRPAGFHEIEYLAGFFRVVEMNTTFHRPLRPQFARLWAQKLRAYPDFRFTAKLYRAFTHDGRFDRRDLQEYCEGLEPLIDAGLLGCVLMQFPWSFRCNRENLSRVLRLARALGQYPLVAEFRHAGWNDGGALRALAEAGVGFCNIDQPQVQQCLPPTEHVTSSIGYVRLHGRNYEQWLRPDEGSRPVGLQPVEARSDYLYSMRQLEKWRERIERIADRTETTYVVTNNCFRGQSVVNALQLLAGLEGRRIEAPPTLIGHYPELNSIARNLPPQRTLFFEQRPQLRRLAPRRTGIAAAYARA